MKSRYILLFLISVWSLGGCSVIDFSDNPNEPQSTSPQSILTNVAFGSFTHNHIWQASMAMRYMVQTADGSIFQTYDWGRGDFAEYNYLRNAQKMIDEAGDEPSSQPYVAIGKILRAHNFFMLTCMYGDVPYFQALEGENTSLDMQERFYPAYDSQEEILTGILLELEEANEILKNSFGLSVENDIVYSGDLTKWRKLANTYQLRILLMMSKKASDTILGIPQRFNEIVSNPGEYPIFTTEEDQALVNYLNTEGVRYPFYNQLGFSTKIYIGKELCDLLVSLKDPRLFIFADPSELSQSADPNARYDFNNYKGVDVTLSLDEMNAVIENKEFSRINAAHYAGNPVGEPSLALSFSEAMLTLAEGVELGWTDAVDAKQCYEQAIRSSFSFYGLSADFDSYIKNPDVAYNARNALTQIYRQRYIIYTIQGDFMSLFHYHRTGFPEMKCGPGQVTVGVPYRMRYPQVEVDMNQSNMENALRNQGFAEDDEMNKLWIYQE